MTDDIFPVDTCVITFITLERFGALMIEHVFLQKSQRDFQNTMQTEVNLKAVLHFPATDLERRPALAAIVALKALKELGVTAFMRVHMEAQIFLSEEA